MVFENVPLNGLAPMIEVDQSISVRLDSYLLKEIHSIREDTHKKSIFFSVRTTKGVGMVNAPDH